MDAEETVSPDRIDNVWDKVRARVRRVPMPESGIEPDVNDEYGDTYIILLAVYQVPMPDGTQVSPDRRYTLRQLDVIAEKIKDELRLLPGVAKAEQYGVAEEAVYIETDLGTWSQLDLTTDQLQKLAQARNIVASGGTLDTDVGRFAVKPGGEFNAVDEMDAIIAGMAGHKALKQPVYLKDMGLTIRRDYEDPPRIICRYGDATTSQPAVIVALSMKSGSNIIDICDAAKARVKTMQQSGQSLPPDIAVTPVSDQSTNVRGRDTDKSDAGEDVIDKWFRRIVRAAINNKFVTVGVAVVLLIAILMLPVGSEFFPKDVRNQFAIQIWLPESSSIEQTDAVAKRVEEILRKLSPTTDADGHTIQQIRAMRTMVGGGGSRWYLSWNPEPQQAYFAEILVQTTDGLFTPHLAKRVREVAEQGDQTLGLKPIVGARVVPR